MVTKGAKPKSSVHKSSTTLKLTQAQLLPYIKRHYDEWPKEWRRADSTYSPDKELKRMKRLGRKYQLPPVGLFTFILIATVLMHELFKSEGIENNKANMDAALDQFEAAINDPEVVAQLKAA